MNFHGDNGGSNPPGDAKQSKELQTAVPFFVQAVRGQRDGVLSAGCLNAGVHALVQVPELLSGWQDYAGRLWDTLFLAAAAFKRSGEKHLVPFEVIYQTEPRRSATVTLWLCFSEYEGFTVLLPEEY